MIYVYYGCKILMRKPDSLYHCSYDQFFRDYAANTDKFFSRQPMAIYQISLFTWGLYRYLLSIHLKYCYLKPFTRLYHVSDEMRWDFVFLMNGFPCWPLRRLLAFVLILHNHEIKWKILLSCLTSLISYILPSCEYTFEVYINLGYFLIFDEQKIKWCMRKFYSLNNETSYVQLL